MKHGYYQHPLYKVWSGICQRCYNPKKDRYKNYGGRGIKMCNEWRNNPSSFIEWALKNGYKKGLQVDRENNNGNYVPSNCRFVTPAQNIQNSRTAKLNWDLVDEIRNAKLLIPNLTQREIASAYNMDCSTINGVLNNKNWKDGR